MIKKKIIEANENLNQTIVQNLINDINSSIKMNQ